MGRLRYGDQLMAWETPYSGLPCWGSVAHYNQFVTYLNGFTDFYNDMLKLQAGTTGTLADIAAMADGACWNSAIYWQRLQDRCSLLVSVMCDWSLVANGQDMGTMSKAQNLHMMHPDEGDTDTFERFVTAANAELSTASITGCDFDNASYTSTTDIPWHKTSGGVGPFEEDVDCIGRELTNQLWAACKVLEEFTMFGFGFDGLGSSGFSVDGLEYSDGATSTTTSCALSRSSFNSGWPQTHSWTTDTGEVPGAMVRQWLFSIFHQWSGTRRRGTLRFDDVPTGSGIDVRICARFVDTQLSEGFKALDTAETENELTDVTTTTGNTGVGADVKTLGSYGDYSASPAEGANDDHTCSDPDNDTVGYRVFSFIAVKQAQSEPS